MSCILIYLTFMDSTLVSILRRREYDADSGGCTGSAMGGQDVDWQLRVFQP